MLDGKHSCEEEVFGRAEEVFGRAEEEVFCRAGEEETVNEKVEAQFFVQVVFFVDVFI